VRRGARVKAARAALARAGCAARKRTKRVRSGTVRKGRVVGLTQRAGTVLRGGAAIGIRVSRGRKIGGIRN
jgi:beta-lactam-binding protein with PASTA domain